MAASASPGLSDPQFAADGRSTWASTAPNHGFMPGNGDDFLDLYWIPVGAGTRFQRASLSLYESIAAARARRSRMTLLHAGLKLGLNGVKYTLEVMPAPPGPNLRNEVTGPVGIRPAGRLRVFRYQACLTEAASLPDEAWAVEPPLRLTADGAQVALITELMREIPPYTWGRRRKGHTEMWTSDSAASWLLGRAGLDVESIEIPAGSRAPGWRAGIEELRLATRDG